MNGHEQPEMRSGSNGQAFHAYLESALAVLDQLSTADYYPKPIPDRADEILDKVVEAYTGWNAAQRHDFLETIPDVKRSLFAIFGQRAATLAVRINDPELLRAGLVGNAIANYKIPPLRNVDSSLAVFYHCARKLGLEPQTLFDDVAAFAVGEMVDRLRVFGRRKDVTLKQFGWREIMTQDGIRFKFEWS